MRYIHATDFVRFLSQELHSKELSGESKLLLEKIIDAAINATERLDVE